MTAVEGQNGLEVVINNLGTIAVGFKKSVAEDNPTIPSDDKPGKGEGVNPGGNRSGNASGNNGNSSPKTGDENNMVIFIILMFASLTALILAGCVLKKKANN